MISWLLASASQGAAAEEVLYEQQIRPRPLHIIVPVNCDGQRRLMILDTGFAMRALDSSLQSHLHEYLREENLDAIGGKLKAKVWKSPPTAVGRWKLPPAEVITLDCAPFRRVLGTDVRGILGLDFLQEDALEVNYDQGRLRFLRNYQPPLSVTPFLPGEKSGGMKFLPVSISDHSLPTVRIELEGIVVNTDIDTGSDGSISLQTETFEKLVANGAIAPEPDSGVLGEVTAAGTFTSHDGTFTRGNILGIDLKGVPVSDGRNVNVLGLSFLLHFNFVYDVAVQRFYFERRHGEPPISAAAMKALFIYRKGHCEVFALRPGPAEDAGLQKGDRILKLGPLRGKELNVYSMYDLCEASAGQTIEVEYARGGKSHPFKSQIQLREKRFIYPVEP
ncbi:MAG: hypothetical protein ABJF10_02340 [Chthoniobacter sp.]|uniref:hypothetical protein n=1 Tax=Chthoniobacter sp. TaxID=2510640 RepID=UPI0032A2E14A